MKSISCWVQCAISTFEVQTILLTHAHVDHITGVAAAKDAFDVRCTSTATISSCTTWQSSRVRCSASKSAQPPVDAYYDGPAIRFGGLRGARASHAGPLPGRRVPRDGRQRARPRHLFVGDTLFAGSIGRTDLPGGDYDVLMRSITEVLFPSETRRSCTRGMAPDTTIGRERRTNPFLLEYWRAGRVRLNTLASLAQGDHLDAADLDLDRRVEPRHLPSACPLTNVPLVLSRSRTSRPPSGVAVNRQ